MSLEAGTKLGPYEILAPFGGNAGETYKASDTRLNRPVAIRVLPAGFSEDPQLKQRLDRDTQTLASLKHPNICAIVDAGREAGADYVVTEYIEGETLAQRLTRGPLELEEALKVAIGIADALDKAHRRGVTHRGLNPSNVMLTPTGVKVFDFGLTSFKGLGAPGSSSSLATALTSSAPMAGVAPFAAPYMAPEQWEGKEADSRTDIFALGTILYEMVTGKPAFEGKTAALLIAAIETIDPDPISKVQPMAPIELDYVVKRCLAKNPKHRLQTAWDLMSHLQWIAERGSQIGAPAVAAARLQKKDRVVWTALAASLLLAAILAPAAFSYFRGVPEPEEVRFIVSNMGNPGVGGGPPVSISPDGHWLIRSPGGTPGLNGVILNSVTPQFLIPDNVVTQPFWSPDSRSIAFFEDGKLKKAEVSGGPAQIICEVLSPLGGGTWNSEGIILFAGGGVIYRVLAAGGQPTAITNLDQSKQEIEHLAPYFLPDGRHYLFLSISSQPSNSALYLGSLDSQEKTRLIASDSRGVYAAPGYILFNREGTVFAQPFDARKLRLTGEPIRIADGVPFVTNGPNVSTNLNRSVAFAVSQSGVFTYRLGGNIGGPGITGGVADRSLIWFDRTGGRAGQVGGPGAYAGVDLSPDGKKVAVHLHDGEGGDSWFFDSAQGRLQRLTFDAAQHNSMPVWAPDGTHVAFGSRRNGKWGVYLKLADGTGKEELLTESELLKMPMSWTPDGKLLLYSVDDTKTRGDVWAVPVTGDRKLIPILQSQFQELNPQVSPDGKWIAYSSNETSRNEIYIKPFPEGPGKWQVSTDSGEWPRWRRDGKELFFVQGPIVMAVDINVNGSSVQPGVPHMLFGINIPGPAHPFYHRFAVSADGQRFLIPQPGTGPIASGGLSDQITAFADQGNSLATTANSVAVVLHWPRLLQRK
jgi:Tol biopolymer transport system component